MTSKIVNTLQIKYFLFTQRQRFVAGGLPNLVVCWGSHCNQAEYQYCRAVGLELGYRELNIITGSVQGIHGGSNERGCY